MTDCTQRLKVLHVAANYPDDVFDQNTTDAVKNLIEATSEDFDHLVVSVARILPPRAEIQIRNGNTISLSYYGLPGTIGHGVAMRRVAKRIVGEVARHAWSVDLIHGHKLTVEGLIARHVAADLGVPYVCTVRGLTDGRVLKWRPDKRAGYRSLLLGAGAVFLPAPWTLRLLKKYLALQGPEVDERRFIILPNIVKTMPARPQSNVPSPQSRLVTVFREGHGKRKGFPQLLKAVADLKAQGYILEVDALGSAIDGMEAGQVASAGLRDQVRILGAFSKAETLSRISTYRGLVLPTQSDTFGMVYTEALLAGVPVLYSGDTGIDGLLDGLDVGVRVDPQSQQDVTRGLKRFSECASELCQNLRESLLAGRLDFLLEPAITRAYTEAMCRVAGIEREPTFIGPSAKRLERLDNL